MSLNSKNMPADTGISKATSPMLETGPHSYTLRLLSLLLRYPNQALTQAVPELQETIASTPYLSPSRKAELTTLTASLSLGDGYEAQMRYVDTFDRNSQACLHLFEHVHGDSRDRGPALVDLLKTYESAGLEFLPAQDGGSDESNAADSLLHALKPLANAAESADSDQAPALFSNAQELPDFLPVVLEFASTQAIAPARLFLGELTHILNAIFSALLKVESPYASVIAAILEFAGEKPQAVTLKPALEMDEAWEVPPAFDGCSNAGQQTAEKPIHFVPKAAQPAAPSLLHPILQGDKP